MQKELNTKVKEIIQRTHNVKSFRLDDTGGVDFTAGQFMSVFLGEEKGLTRFLSISSSPAEKGFIEFTKKITDSKFSKKLNAAEAGSPIRIKYPMGSFTIREGRNKLAFLSGGIGITPIRNIEVGRRHACAAKEKGRDHDPIKRALSLRGVRQYCGNCP